MTIPDEDLVLISAIEHYAYCPRQFALMHIEQTFEDNALTLRGDRVHENVDLAHALRSDGVKTEYAVPLWSEDLGLVGRADVVEFRADGVVRPVEYKHGDRRPKRHDDLQICAQALCLEEMLGIRVDGGAIFYHKTRRCREVVFEGSLRSATIEVVDQARALMRSGAVPEPVADQRCPPCSLVELCSPELLVAARSWAAPSLTRLPNRTGVK